MIYVSYDELPEDVGVDFGITSRELFADIMTGILNDPELKAIVVRKLKEEDESEKMSSSYDEWRKLVEGELLSKAKAWGLAKEYHDACDAFDATLDLRWRSGRGMMQRNAFRVLQQVAGKAKDMNIPMEDVMHEIRNYRGPSGA